MRRILGAAAASVLALGTGLGLGGSLPAAADANWAFAGGGWGHGVGMSQWGARGMAEQGSSAAAILGHYYTGTAVTGRGESADIRVLVGVSSSFLLTAWGPTLIGGVGTVPAVTQFRVSRSGDSIVLSGGVSATVGSVLLIDQGGVPLTVNPPAHSYRRGGLAITLDPGGGLRAIVGGLTMNQYLRGLGEMPSSWPAEALKAQAIAGRTYAETRLERPERASLAYDLNANVDGAYIGDDKEFGSMGDRWNAAVDATNGQFVTYNGGLISAVFSASSGGYTENSEAVWGSPLPYLRGVPDPADALGGNPNFSWTVNVSGTQLGAAFGLGPVTSVTAGASPGVSGRMDRATVTLVDSAGRSRAVNGAQLRSALGLKSTRFSIAGAQVPRTDSGIAPIGALDTVQAWNGSTLLVGGRAGDPDGPILVRIDDTVAGTTRTRGALAANGHFLDASTPPRGAHRVCVTLYDNPTGLPVSLGCRNTTIK